MWRNGEAEEEEDNMDEDHIVKFVEIYLKKKGFKQAEIAFQEEVHKSNSSTANTYNNYGDLHSDSEFSKLILLFSRNLMSLCSNICTSETTILGIINNEHINFQVSPGQPCFISNDTEAVTLIGSSQDVANQINKKEIHFGGGGVGI
ncbi:uncharacterized protein LOC119997532 isoform X3 [Tripterygium wilfordii]|uniref:uncharacterized protein LOC119997532 isoform X3 n=1 Tax=Tripterygium wilfordii TaxID=458696 RepID=UPI0018F83B47|nr:uncharacterized protein LOC119997532 isoform X3 [Tripterygium wilfordii]